jgi:hypothetical protein
MNRIDVILATGIPFPAAVRAVLGSIRDFSAAHDVSETAVSGLINGSAPYPYERERAALAVALGVERAWLDQRLDALHVARTDPEADAAA